MKIYEVTECCDELSEPAPDGALGGLVIESLGVQLSCREADMIG